MWDDSIIYYFAKWLYTQAFIITDIKMYCSYYFSFLQREWTKTTGEDTG